MAVTDNDRFVFSQSMALQTSTLPVYDGTQFKADGNYTDGGINAPLIFVDSRTLVKTVEAPPMSEGSDIVNGKLYMPEESASLKYFFGRLYNASEVFAWPECTFSGN